MRALVSRLDTTCAGLALAFVALLLFAGSRDVFWTGDFYVEVYHPAYLPLQRGDVGAFLHHLPGYASFTFLVGAPAALLADALGGTDTLTFAFCATPGLLTLAALGARLGHETRARKGWPVYAVLGAGGPIAYQTVLYGHPEDLLAAAAAVGAVLAALHGRSTAAALLLVAGVAAKQWAVLAILPAALAAPRGGIRIVVLGGAGATLIVAAQTLLVPVSAASMTGTGGLFHPHQLWWPFGIPAPVEFIADGHGVRTAPVWLQPLTRPLVIGTGIVLSALWWLRGGSSRRREDALALLALALLLRCALDPWNLVYYHLPCVLALAAWEARRGRPYPVLSLGVSAAAWLSFVTYAERETDGPFLLYMAWALPLALGLAATVFGRSAAGRTPVAAPQPA